MQRPTHLRRVRPDTKQAGRSIQKNIPKSKARDLKFSHTRGSGELCKQDRMAQQRNETSDRRTKRPPKQREEAAQAARRSHNCRNSVHPNNTTRCDESLHRWSHKGKMKIILKGYPSSFPLKGWQRPSRPCHIVGYPLTAKV